MNKQMCIFLKSSLLTFFISFQDVDRFQNGSVHELYCLKVCQVSKVPAYSTYFHKITNEPEG